MLPANKFMENKGYWFFAHLPGTNVEVIDNRSPFPLRLFRRILRIEFAQAFKALLRQDGYDVVLSHSFNSAFVFALLRSLMSRIGPPHYVIDVGSLNGGRNTPIQIAILKFTLRSVTGLIYHSTVNEEFYAKHFPKMKRKFVLLGENPDVYSPEHGEQPGGYALSIGHPTQRDYDTLIRAWTRVEFPLKIVGSTSIDKKGLKNVELLPVVSADELRRLINDSRFVILPIANFRYSIGQTTLIQCMAMQKPVIVSLSFGVRDYCEHGKNCLTYECGNDSELASEVNLLLRKPDLAQNIARSARADVLSRFNEKKMAESILEFITSTPANARGP